MRLRGVVGVAVVVCACDLPGRDNVNDPAYAPNAVLRITPWEGGRTTEFALDASGSTDPFARGALSYKWDFDYRPGDTEFDAVTSAAVVSNHTFSLTHDDLCAQGFCGGIGSVARTVRVVVTASSGHYAEASAAILLRNSAPTVSTGEDLYVSEVVPTVVELDGCGGGTVCTTTDPEDDDPLGFSWHWEQVFGSDVAIVNSNARVATFTIDSPDPRPYVFRVTASDGLTSSSGIVQVFRESQLWIGSVAPVRIMRAFPEGAYIEDPAFGDGPIDDEQYYLGASILAGEMLWLSQTSAGWQGGPTVDTAQVRPLTRTFGVPKFLSNWEIPGALDQPGEGVVSLAALGAGDGCAAVNDFQNRTWARLHNGGTVTVTSTPDSVRRAAFVASTDVFECWTVDAKSGIGRLREFDWVEVEPPSAASLNASSRVMSAVSDESSRLWIAEYDFNGTFQDPNDDLARLRIIGAQDTSSTLIQLPAGVRRLTRLGRWSGDEVWVTSRERGLSLVSSDGTWSDPEIVSSLPIAGDDIGAFASDPAGSVLWLSRISSGTLHRLEYIAGVLVESGVLSVEEIYDEGGLAPFSQIIPDAMNASAYVYVGAVAETQKVIARVPPHLRREADVPSGDFTYVNHLLAGGRGGTLWVSRPYQIEGTNAGKGLVRITHTGRKVVDLPEVSVGASDVAADGTIWTVEGNQLVHRGNLGEVLVSYPMGSLPVGSLSVAKSFACVAFDSGTPPRTGGAARVDLLTGAVTNMSSMVAGTSWIPSLAAAASDDACWFVAKAAADPSCCVPAQNGPLGCSSQSLPRALRYAPGELTPSVTLQFDDDMSAGTSRTPEVRDDPTCPLSIDADPYDGGIWVADFDYDSSRVRRIDTPNGEVKRFGGYGNPPHIAAGVTRVSIDRCPSLDLACRRVYMLTSVDTEMRNQDGDVLNRWVFPAGQPNGLAFSR